MATVTGASAFTESLPAAWLSELTFPGYVEYDTAEFVVIEFGLFESATPGTASDNTSLVATYSPALPPTPELALPAADTVVFCKHRLDDEVDWFGCIADTREQWQRYQAVSDELSDRDPTRVPACDECGARQWRTSAGELIHCQSCQITPTRERPKKIRRVWTTITPHEEVTDGDH